MTRMLATTLALTLTLGAASLALANGFDRHTPNRADIYALVFALDLGGDTTRCPPEVATPDTSCLIAPYDVTLTQAGLERIVLAGSGLDWVEEWRFLGGDGTYLRVLLLAGPPMKALVLGITPLGFPAYSETLVVVTLLPEN